MRRSRVVALATALLFLQFLSPMCVLADESIAGASLDLSSTERTIEAGHHEGFETAVIHVGDNTRTVGPHDLLTPAEHVALHQVLSSGQQSIILSAVGSAVGGTVNLTPEFAEAVHNLVIPQGVTAIHDFGVREVVNLVGNLTNSGAFHAVSSNSQVTSASINASSIINAQAALLTSLSPASGIAGIESAVSSLDLNLTAVNDIINHGTITSSGSLTATAGGSIINAVPTGAGGPTPVMQAMGNVNLTSGAGIFQNAGLISSATGNINVGTQTVQNIVVNNIGGTLEALQGAINLRDATFAEKANLLLAGGDALSKELNLYSGTGTIQVSMGQISGVVNAFAHTAEVEAGTDALTIGNVQLTGDPTFFNRLGDVILAGQMSFGGADLAIVAGDDVRASSVKGPVTIDSAGGDILMVAGAFFTVEPPDKDSALPTSGSGDTTSTLKVTGLGGSDSEILLASTPTLPIRISTGGGDLTLIAGSGRIDLFPEGGLKTQGGKVTVIAGKPFDPGVAVLRVGQIDTSGGSGTSGDIQLFASQPSLAPCMAPCDPAVVIRNGTIISGRFIASGVTAGSVIALDLNAGKGRVSILAGKNALITNVTSARSVGAVANLGVVDSQPFIVGLAPGEGPNGVLGTVTTISDGVFGSSVGFTNFGKGGMVVRDPARLVVVPGPNSGPSLAFDAGEGTLSVPSVVWDANAISNGQGGRLTFAGKAVQFDGPAMLNARGSGTGMGGVIELRSEQVSIPGSLSAVADGGSRGSGGRISFFPGAFVSNAPVNVTAQGPIELSARSGDGSTGLGGVIEFFAADISVSGSSFSAKVNGFGGGTFRINGANVTISGGPIAIETGSMASFTGGVIDIFASQSLTFSAPSLSLLAPAGGSSTSLIKVRAIGDLILNTSSTTISTSTQGTFGSTINLSASKLVNSGIATVSANGSTFGGIVQVTLLAADSDLSIGSSIGQVSISANSTDTSSNFSSGGRVEIHVGRSLAVDTQHLQARVSAQQGDGGSVRLFAGTSGSGLLTVAGEINVDGKGSGNGGAIELDAPEITFAGAFDSLSADGGMQGSGGTVSVTARASQSQLFIDTGAGAVTISATGSGPGSNLGNGGSVSVSAGGSLIANSGSIDVRVLGNNGRGGSITLRAGTANNLGELLLNGDVHADGKGTGQGGSVTIEAPQINFGLDGLVLTANGAGTGSGGSVTVTARGQASTVLLAQSNDGIQITASGGSQGSVSGDGGTITVSSAGDLIVNSGAISAAALGTNGAGGAIAFEAGFQTGTGVLDIRGDLRVDGKGNRNGGSINLKGPTIVTNGPLNLSANAGGFAKGGTISITTTGPAGDIRIAPDGISASATGGSANSIAGDGGQILATAGRNLTVNSANLSVAVLGNSGAGGKITLQAGTNASEGVLHLTGNLNADGKGSFGTGGSITLRAPAIATAGPSLLSANGGGSGKGGFITVLAEGKDADVAINPAGISLSATGGSPGTFDGGGGDVLVSAGRNLTVNPAQLSVAALGSGGDGGKITLTAGVLNSDGVLQLGGNLSANGKGSFGIGGQITLTAPSIKFTGDALPLSANGAGGGKGGVISVRVSGPGGLAVGKEGGALNATARGGDTGNGGEITITSDYSLALDPSAIDVKAGTSQGNGGTIRLTAGVSGSGALTFSKPGQLNADAGAFGNGGTIILDAAFGPGGHIALPEGTTLSARGGSTAGNGGKVTLKAGGNLNITGGVIVVTPSRGNGGTIELLAGQAGGLLGILTINGELNASATTQGNGGTVTVNTQFLNVVDKNLRITGDGAGTGNGGTITIDVTQDTRTLMLGNGSGQIALSATSGMGGGNGAKLLSVKTPGSIAVDAGAIVNASALGSTGNGGTIRLEAGAYPTDPFASANLVIDGTVQADGGSQNGSGGTVNLAFRNLPIIATGPGLFVNLGAKVSADQHGSGTGGTVTVVNLENGPLIVEVDGTLSADGVADSLGKLVFKQEGQPVSVTGTGNQTGKLIGKVDAAGSSVEIEAEAIGAKLTILNAIATDGGVTLRASSDGASIDLLQAGRVSASENVLISSQSVKVGVGSVSTGFTVTGNNIQIETVDGSGGTPGGDITLMGDVRATSAVELRTRGAGRIVQTRGIVAAEELTLSAVTGNVGPINISASRLRVNSDIDLHTVGDVTVSQVIDVASGEPRPLELQASKGNNFKLSAVSDVTVTGDLVARASIAITTGKSGAVTNSALITAGLENVTITAGGDIRQISLGPAPFIEGRKVTLESQNGSIGFIANGLLNEVSVRSPAPGSEAVSLLVVAQGHAIVTSLGKVVLGTSRAGELFDLETVNVGQIEVVGAVNAHDIVLRTGRDTNADVIINGGIQALDSAELEANGRGNIQGPSGSVSAPEIRLFSGTGHIAAEVGPDGVASGELIIAADALTAMTAVTGGAVQLANAGTNALRLEDSTAGARFTLFSQTGVSVGNLTSGGPIVIATTGSLNVRDGSTVAAGANATGDIRGDIQLSSNGSLTIGASGALFAVEGSILLASGGVITLNASSAVTASTGNSGNTGAGNVFMFAGGQSGTLAPAFPIENFLPTTVQDGVILWGPKMVEAHGSLNTALAINRTIVLDAGSAEIVLNGGAAIRALGPIKPTLGLLPPGLRGQGPPGQAGISPGLAGQTPGQSGSQPPGQLYLNPGLINNPADPDPPGQSKTPPGQQKKAARTEDTGTRALAYAEDGSQYLPVRYVHPTAPLGPLDGQRLSVITWQQGQIWALGAPAITVTRDGDIHMQDGEILVVASRPISMRLVGRMRVVLRKGAMALVCRRGQTIKVVNVSDNQSDSVRCYLSNIELATLAPGLELLVGENVLDVEAVMLEDGVARRPLLRHRSSPQTAVALNEVSHVSLVQKDSLLSAIRRSPHDGRLVRQLMKTAAAVSVLNRARDPYSAPAKFRAR